MSRWSEKLMTSLDGRAMILETERGPIQVARDGAGPKVMTVHGSPGGFDQGLVWARHLRDGGCELIAPSRPGYLRTPLDSGRNPAQQADLYAAMLDALHIKKVTVLGISSGGPSAVHFAARHPNRTKALLLDAAVLLPIAPAINAVERAIFESSVGTWLSYEIAKKRPKLTATLIVDALAAGLSKDRKRDAVDWITSNPARLHDIADLPPPSHREGSGNQARGTTNQMKPISPRCLLLRSQRRHSLLKAPTTLFPSSITQPMPLKRYMVRS